MTKNLFLRLCLMFCAITLSVSCRNDLLQEHNANEQARKILTSKILHYSDLEGNPSLLRHMKKASGQSITLENGKLILMQQTAFP